LLATQAADKGTHPSDTRSIPAKTYISDRVNISPMLRKRTATLQILMSTRVTCL